MQMRPEFAFRHPGDGMFIDARHPGLACADRPAHQGDFVDRLDGAGDFGQLRAVNTGEAPFAERVDARTIEFVAGDPFVASTIFADKTGDFISPGSDGHLGLVAVRHEHPRLRDPDFVNSRKIFAQVQAALELEHDGRTTGQDQCVAQRVVQGPDLHVGAVERVADVAGIMEQQCAAVGPGQLVA